MPDAARAMAAKHARRGASQVDCISGDDSSLHVAGASPWRGMQCRKEQNVLGKKGSCQGGTKGRSWLGEGAGAAFSPVRA